MKTPTEASLNKLAFLEEKLLATSGATAYLGLQLREANRRMTWAAAWLKFAASRGDDSGLALQEAATHLRRAQRALNREAGR